MLLGWLHPITFSMTGFFDCFYLFVCEEGEQVFSKLQCQETGKTVFEQGTWKNLRTLRAIAPTSLL